MALDDAMNALARLDPRKVKIVEVLKVSPGTVMRVKAWIYRELTGGIIDGF